MSEMNLMKRLKGPTPAFFKRVINIALTLAGVGTALLSADALPIGFTLPPVMVTLSQWFIVAGVIASAVAKTTVDHPQNNQP